MLQYSQLNTNYECSPKKAADKIDVLELVDVLVLFIK